MPSPTVEALPPYRRPAAEVVAGLGSDARRGLPATEARARLDRDGPNLLPSVPPTPGWRRFLAQFRDVLTILLLVATAVSFVGLVDRARGRRSPTRRSPSSPSCS